MGNLVFWGHHVDEYQEMFALEKKDLQGKILEFGCGPSAFNIEAQKKSVEVISCDPLFNLDYAILKTKTSLVFADMLTKVKACQDKYDFSAYGSLNNLIRYREQGMQHFFADYEKGLTDERYLGVNSLSLPFSDGYFDLALSSHYFFAGLEQQDVNFHVQALKELARVAKEVRIFPLINREGITSELLGPVLLALQQENYGTEVRSIPYHLQPQGNAMLRIWAHTCDLS